MQPLALVTGGNRGIGLETVRQLAARSFRVLLASRDESSGSEAVRSLAGKGLEVELRRMDVTDPASLEAVASRLRADGRILDVLVNNAGGSLNGFDAGVARGTLAVNFFGAMSATDALLPVMRDGGTIVMVSSGLGELAGLARPLHERFSDPALTRAALVELVESFVRDVAGGRHAEAGWPSNAYRVSKIALNALTRILARELAPRGIRVNAACPGWVRTRMGGRGAPRSVEEGAASIVWAAALGADGPTGGFFRDGRVIAW